MSCRRTLGRAGALGFSLALLACRPAHAEESPYFVTYDHGIEEPGELEVALASTWGVPRSGQRAFIAPYLELEYGAAPWWASSLYLEAQSTRGDSTVFTGWRFENRFRPLRPDQGIIPVFYLEYEHVNAASRIFKEVVGTSPTLGPPNNELRRETSHELEGRIILSSDRHGWNVAGNLILEKNLTENEPLELGYALGVSRPLKNPGAVRCRFCLDALTAGVEVYGGLGSTGRFGFRDTSQYVAPAVSWQLAGETSLRLSTAFGLTEGSNPALIRLAYTYEFEEFGPFIGGRR